MIKIVEANKEAGMRLGRGVMLGAALAMWVAVVVSLAGMAAAQAARTDLAYANGYNAGYGQGSTDHSTGQAANAHKFRQYQDATDGYSVSYGSPEAYRRGYQSGFEDGYNDGFAGHERSVPAPAADAPPAAPPADLAKTASGNGYREGYNIGKSDANSQAVYNATASHEYQEASVGYAAALGDSAAYQQAFRSGFRTGYDDGFNHHLYNSSLGARRNPAADPAPATVDAAGLLVPQGTQVHATLDQGLDTKNSYAGEAFSVTVTVPIWVGSVAAIPAGSTIQGTVKQVTRGGKLSGHAQLQLAYTTLTLPGKPPISLDASTAAVGTEAVDQNEGTVNGKGADAGKHAATGAAIGAVLGGIFGGGGGLIRGGAAGAAAGTAGVLISHSKDLTLQQGEPMLLRLEQALTVPQNSGQ